MEKLVNVGQITYVVGAHEFAPSTGQPHGQGYIEKPPRAKTTIKGVMQLFEMLDLPPCHIEIAKESGSVNRAYCLKSRPEDTKPNDLFFEFGRIRSDHKLGPGVRGRTDWQTAYKLAQEGRFADIEPYIQIAHMGNLQKIQFMAPRDIKEQTVLENYWLHGKSGTGKSRLAREIGTWFKGLYLKDALNKWFDMYNGEECILFDDVELDCKYQGHLLKTLADHYVLSGEIKGTSTKLRPKCVVITSNYRIDQIWSDADMVAAIARRFFVVEVVNFETARQVVYDQHTRLHS